MDQQFLNAILNNVYIPVKQYISTGNLYTITANGNLLWCTPNCFKENSIAFESDETDKTWEVDVQWTGIPSEDLIVYLQILEEYVFLYVSRS